MRPAQQHTYSDKKKLAHICRYLVAALSAIAADEPTAALIDVVNRKIRPYGCTPKYQRTSPDAGLTRRLGQANNST